MTWEELLKAASNRLSQAGVPDPELDAWYLMEAAYGLSRARYYLEAKKPAEAKTADFSARSARFEELLSRREGREPLQQILGTQEFMGLSFLVNRHVLIPRQDTETLVELVLKEVKDREARILDLCTGSGCIAASLYLIGKKQGKVFPDRCFDAADISAEALDTARENCRALGAQVRLIHSDLFERIEGSYDMIVSNPPYIRRGVIEGLQEEVRLHDPYIALDGHEDGLYFYRRIADEAGRHLKRGGWVLLEIGHDQSKDVSRLLAEAGFTCIQGKKDLAGLDRVVMGMYNK